MIRITPSSPKTPSRNTEKKPSLLLLLLLREQKKKRETDAKRMEIHSPSQIPLEVNHQTVLGCKLEIGAQSGERCPGAKAVSPLISPRPPNWISIRIAPIRGLRSTQLGLYIEIKPPPPPSPRRPMQMQRREGRKRRAQRNEIWKPVPNTRTRGQGLDEFRICAPGSGNRHPVPRRGGRRLRRPNPVNFCR